MCEFPSRTLFPGIIYVLPPPLRKQGNSLSDAQG